MIWRAIRWLLFLFDPERVHHLAVVALRGLGWRPLARRLRCRPRPALELETLGLRFEHPLGLAAGFDKGEVVAPGLFALGFSHVEIGTLTPRAQEGNPRPRLFRLPEHRALLNRMGFNNEGAEEDYLACIDRLHPFADYLVVNISSPNTPGLRELQERASLERLLRACVERVRTLPRPVPLLVKLAPDLSGEAMDEALDVALAVGVSGIVATNTTVQRPGPVAAHPQAGEAGGLSGEPLGPLSLASLRRAYARVGGRIPIVAVGGVMTPEDAYLRIRAGATLVQAYTGYIYGGPRFVHQVARGLEEALRRDGFSRIHEAIGADLRGGRAG